MSTGPGCPAEDLSSAALALARRLSGGATLWSVSPAWPEHAQHVAVEFVHPVIVGKRALPAVAVHDAEPVGALRALGRAGDVLLGIGSSDEPVVVDLMRRAAAWGLETVWIGAGLRPRAGAADHVLWLDDVLEHHLAPYTGGFVLLYHLLWELTHVCFEHPGLLVDDKERRCTDEVCITCSDAAEVGEVMAVRTDGAFVRTADGPLLIDVSLIEDVQVADLLVIHAGTALERVGGSVVGGPG